MKRRTVFLFVITLFTYHLSLITSSAQCTYKNTAFQGNEFLSYNLYYNWKFVWVKGGTASLSTVQTTYRGKAAYRASLNTRALKKVDDMFLLRDTLLCYTTTELAPLYFRKGAREGKRYTVDEVFFSYKGGQSHTLQQRRHTDGTVTRENHSSPTCLYDMLSVFLRARSFDATGWKKGHTIPFSMADDTGITSAQLRYGGKEVVKADNGKRYRCLKLSYYEKEKGKMKEIMRLYVSDDLNHVPIRIDAFLRVGSAKAYLVNMKGLRNPVTSLQ